MVIPFYLIKRDIRIPQGARKCENDAEHSWSLSVVACALAPQIDPSLDVGKVCQFATVHDLVELYADDTSPWGSNERMTSKEDREHDALKRIKTEFGQFPWIAETIAEYEQKDTNEARFVWAVDKYVTLFIRHLDDGKFFRSIKLTKEKFDERLKGHHRKAHAHKTVGEYYDTLRSEIYTSPGYFYNKDT